MLLSIFTNRWIVTLVCALVVFGEMFLVKGIYTRWTKNINNAKVKTALNIVFGLAFCFALSMLTMFVYTDVIGGVYAWKYVIAAALGATLIYLILEKIFGNAVVNKIGTAFAEYLTRSGLFDGKITEKGLVAVAEKMLGNIKAIDEAKYAKQTKAVNEVVKTLDGMLADGVVTAEEKEQATKLINENGIDVNQSAYEKYKALLNK